MKIIIEELLITEIVEEGLELGHEFECGHNGYTKKVWEEVVTKYKIPKVKNVQNVYYDGKTYQVVLVMENDTKETEELSFDFLNSLDFLKHSDMIIKND